jgi:hypothetical protein
VADIIDHANDIAELNLQAELAAALKHTGPKATGYCLYCEEQLHNDLEIEMIEADQFIGMARRWCDADCRDWWEES